MNEQNWIPTEYESWDEAFRGLLPVIRQQSVRVASYAQVLYVQACASGFGQSKGPWKNRMMESYEDLAYKCGLYHQLGKAVLPEEYQLANPNFSDEERATFQSYTKAGRLLVSKLQTGDDKKKYENKERPTKNVPWLMVRETCEQHMERWDGSGYPSGLVGNEISPMAQIVGLAKELDRLASETKSENPFDEAYIVLIQQSGKEFSEELIEILKASRGKCRGIYRKYIQYTQTLPKTIPLVDKRKERTLGLTYRPIGESMYEAIPWFGGVLGQPEERESMEVLEPMMARTNTTQEIMFYFLYEAADLILRMQNCRLTNGGVMVPMAAAFYKGEILETRFRQLFEDQPIDSSKLLLTVPMEMVLEADKQEKENLITYIEDGLQLVLDGYNPEELLFEQVREIGFAHVRLAQDLSQETRVATIEMLQANGINCIGYGVPQTEVEEETLIAGLMQGER